MLNDVDPMVSRREIGDAGAIIIKAASRCLLSDCEIFVYLRITFV